MPQFSLRALLIAVTAIAVSTAALWNANDWWGAFLFAAELGLLCFAAIAVFCGADSQRSFWTGYLLAGGIHVLVLAFALQAGDSPHSPFYPNNILTTRLFAWVYEVLPKSKNTPSSPGFISLIHLARVGD